MRALFFSRLFIDYMNHDNHKIKARRGTSRLISSPQTVCYCGPHSRLAWSRSRTATAPPRRSSVESGVLCVSSVVSENERRRRDAGRGGGRGMAHGGGGGGGRGAEGRCANESTRDETRVETRECRLSCAENTNRTGPHRTGSEIHQIQIRNRTRKPPPP